MKMSMTVTKTKKKNVDILGSFSNHSMVSKPLKPKIGDLESEVIKVVTKVEFDILKNELKTRIPQITNNFRSVTRLL